MLKYEQKQGTSGAMVEEKQRRLYSRIRRRTHSHGSWLPGNQATESRIHLMKSLSRMRISSRVWFLREVGGS